MTDSAHLVLDIVFSDDKAFDCELSKEQISNLILLDKNVLMNPNIWRMYCKHYAYYLYNKLYTIIKNIVRNEDNEDNEDNKNKKMKF